MVSVLKSHLSPMSPDTAPTSASPATGEGFRVASSPPHAPRALWLEDWLTVLIMALLALITFANVLARYFTHQSFAWTEEISIFLMMVLTLVAGSAAVARRQHVRIEYFADGGSLQRQRRLAQFAALMVALLFAILCVLSIRMVWDEWRFEEISPGIGVPSWWYSIWLPIFSVAIVLRALGLWWYHRSLLVKNKESGNT